ncbi:MAG: helix-turn-helix transcriptional regulator [Desulfitobacteriaceae bacterium]
MPNNHPEGITKFALNGFSVVIYKMNLANNKIQWVLNKRDWTQQDLSDRVGMYHGDISDIIAGKKKRLTLVNAAKISMELGYSIEYLWPGLFK